MSTTSPLRWYWTKPATAPSTTISNWLASVLSRTSGIAEPCFLVRAVAQRLVGRLPATAQRHAVAGLETGDGDAAGDPERAVVDDGDADRQCRLTVVGQRAGGALLHHGEDLGARIV